LGQVVAVGHTVRWMKIIFRQKLPKVFFLQNKKIYLINIFWTSDTHLKEFCMLYQEKILNLIFGSSCGHSHTLKYIANTQLVTIRGIFTLNPDFHKMALFFLGQLFWFSSIFPKFVGIKEYFYIEAKGMF